MFRQSLLRSTRLFSTAAPRWEKSAVDSAKEAVHNVDKTVSEKLVKGIEKTEETAQSARQAAGMKASEAEAKAEEAKGMAKGKAHEVAGEAKGKAAEVKGKM